MLALGGCVLMLVEWVCLECCGCKVLYVGAWE